jgi:site-specific DNA-methyltransferase (adenine-specific)
LACAVEDAGFEIRDQIMWIYGCLDEQTECLTAEGWKHYTNLSTADKVLQWDSATGELWWGNPIKVLVAPYCGPMVHLKNRHTDQLLTPNHRVYAKIRRHSRNKKPEVFEVVKAGDLKRNWQIDLPMAGQLVEGHVAMQPVELAYLAGWWMTDAWAHEDGKAVMFSQSKPKTLKRLRAALRPFKHSEYVKQAKKATQHDEHTFYVPGGLATWLLEKFPDRSLPWSVMGWCLDARKRLFDGLIDGDGSIKEGQYAWAFWSKKTERRAVFLALAASLGHRAYEDAKKGVVYFNMKTSTTQLQSRHRLENVHYEGNVWCLRVTSGAFMVRRSGRVFITGNSGFPKSLDVSKAIDKAAGEEREVTGTKFGLPGYRLGEAAGNEIYGHGLTNGSAGCKVTAPATDAAKQWSGWGTALKPSHEPIVVARKPLIGTVAANVLQYGTGAINIDACRVGFLSGEREGMYRPMTKNNSIGWKNKSEYMGYDTPDGLPPALGRWPANVIHDGSEEVLAAFPDAPGQLRASDDGQRTQQNVYGKYGTNGYGWEPRGDAGSAARFYYCAKASREERNRGLWGTEEKIVDDGRKVPIDNPYLRGKTMRSNTHPTVKPIALMTYLCRLVTPPQGTVLDLFMGSGSTGIAALREGFNFIGIEVNPEYVEIARLRIEGDAPLFNKQEKAG